MMSANEQTIYMQGVQDRRHNFSATPDPRLCGFIEGAQSEAGNPHPSAADLSSTIANGVHPSLSNAYTSPGLHTSIPADDSPNAALSKATLANSSPMITSDAAMDDSDPKLPPGLEPQEDQTMNRSTVPKRSSPLRPRPSFIRHKSDPLPLSTQPRPDSECDSEIGCSSATERGLYPYTGLSHRALQERKMLWLRRHHLWATWDDERRAYDGAYLPVPPSLRSFPTPCEREVCHIPSEASDAMFPRIGDLNSLKAGKAVWMDMRFREFPLNAIRKTLYAFDMDHRVQQGDWEGSEESDPGVSPTGESEQSWDSSGTEEPERVLMGSGSDRGYSPKRADNGSLVDVTQPGFPAEKTNKERVWETRWDVRWGVFNHLVRLAVQDIEDMTASSPSSASSIYSLNSPSKSTTDLLEQDDLESDTAAYAEDVATSTDGRVSPVAKFFVYDEERDGPGPLSKRVGRGGFERHDDGEEWSEEEEDDYGDLLPQPAHQEVNGGKSFCVGGKARPNTRRGREFKDVDIR